MKQSSDNSYRQRGEIASSKASGIVRRETHFSLSSSLYLFFTLSFPQSLQTVYRYNTAITVSSNNSSSSYSYHSKYKGEEDKKEEEHNSVPYVENARASRVASTPLFIAAPDECHLKFRYKLI